MKEIQPSIEDIREFNRILTEIGANEYIDPHYFRAFKDDQSDELLLILRHQMLGYTKTIFIKGKEFLAIKFEIEYCKISASANKSSRYFYDKKRTKKILGEILMKKYLLDISDVDPVFSVN